LVEPYTMPKPGMRSSIVSHMRSGRELMNDATMPTPTSTISVASSPSPGMRL
jgi:hypothetical protein